MFIFSMRHLALFNGLVRAFSLSQWYERDASILHACFVTGNEEVLLVDSYARARVFSLVTRQFR